MPSDFELPRELDDQDRVLGGQRDHQHQADLRVEIARQAPDGQRDDDTHEGHRHRKNHGRGSGPAFVLGGEHQKNQRDRQRENEVSLVADKFLLIGKPSPIVACVQRQVRGRDPLHNRERVARTVSRRRRADQGAAGYKL